MIVIPDRSVKVGSRSFRNPHSSLFGSRLHEGVATLFALRKRFGGMDVDEVKRLKVLKTENCRLKKNLAERDLEIDVMKEIVAKKW